MEKIYQDYITTMQAAYKFNLIALDYDTDSIIRNANPEILPAAAYLLEVMYRPQT
jgi:hypothetical protein